MSEKLIVKETLSINSTVCLRTDNAKLINQFLDDFKELYAEWQSKVQITSMNIAIHDHRGFSEFSTPSEAKQWHDHGEAVAVYQGEKEED